MQQPVPDVAPADVDRVIKLDFSPELRPEVTRRLAKYGTENWEQAVTRVRLAILKLANGDIEELERYVQVAKLDFRDVVAWAEYPGYMKHVRIPPNLENKIIEADWQQYQEWLKR